MAAHSRVLAWGIPWTEEPGGLQPMGLQRVRHNRSDPAAARELAADTAGSPASTQRPWPQLAS